MCRYISNNQEWVLLQYVINMLATWTDEWLIKLCPIENFDQN